MKWNKITLEIREEVEDIVISTLADIGLEGAEIQDKQPLSEQDKKQMFVDILPDMPEDDGVAYLNFYLDEDEDVNAMLEKVKAELEELRMFVDIGSGMITYCQTETTDEHLDSDSCLQEKERKGEQQGDSTHHHIII